MAWPFRRERSAPPAADPPRRRRTDRPVTLARVRQWYERPTSFTNLLPWMEYDPATGCFLLEDSISWAALFELTPRACEARPATYLEELHGHLQALLTEVFPEEEAGWWVLQFYLQDESSLLPLRRQVRQSPAAAVRASAYTRAWLAQLEAHFERLMPSVNYFLTSVTIIF